MKDPARLLDDGGTDFERSLLSALRSETPSPELSRRMQQGLAGAGVAAGTKLAAASIGKIAVAGLVAVGLAGGIAAFQYRRAPSPTPPPAEAAAPVVAVSEPAPTSAPAAPAGEPPPPAVAARPRPQPSASGDLREEIRALDEVRAALRADEGERALKLLNRYARRHPRGEFRQEAAVLRVEALEKSGDASAASALGKKFVAEHPESPHVERVERVTGGSGK